MPDSPLVLVVEDHPDMNAYLVEILQDRYRVASAVDGQDGLEKARMIGPDLILADVMMPRMTGDKLLDHVRGDPRLGTVPMLILTARDESELRARMLRKGVQDFLQKPFSSDELLARIENLLHVRDEMMTLRRDLAMVVEEVERRNALLTEADRRKDQFIAMLAHELRNPLAPLTIGMHLLQQSGIDPVTRAELHVRMQRQLGHLTNLINQLLDVARFEHGKIHIRRDRLELGTLTRDAVADQELLFGQAGIRLLLTRPDYPVPVFGDATRLHQVLLNLIDNARKFTAPGGRVSVRLTTGHSPALATIEVEDDGIGIDPATLPRLFEVFCQAERSLDRPGGGLGLGLAVARGLIRLHGGDITAESAGPGRGSLFRVTLPIVLETGS